MLKDITQLMVKAFRAHFVKKTQISTKVIGNNCAPTGITSPAQHAPAQAGAVLTS